MLVSVESVHLVLHCLHIIHDSVRHITYYISYMIAIKSTYFFYSKRARNIARSSWRLQPKLSLEISFATCSFTTLSLRSYTCSSYHAFLLPIRNAIPIRYHAPLVICLGRPAPRFRLTCNTKLYYGLVDYSL